MQVEEPSKRSNRGNTGFARGGFVAAESSKKTLRFEPLNLCAMEIRGTSRHHGKTVYCLFPVEPIQSRYNFFDFIFVFFPRAFYDSDLHRIVRFNQWQVLHVPTISLIRVRREFEISDTLYIHAATSRNRLTSGPLAVGQVQPH